LQPVEEFAKTLCLNNEAIKRYRGISDVYLEMLIPHFYKT
jgi:hypothetical protein